MALLNEAFDASTVDPATSFPVYPADKYLVQIIQSEMRATKDGNGQFLWMELEILDGEFAGGKLFDRLNLVNGNTTAQEIAQRTLSAICHAVGVMQVSDSEQLHFKPMVAEVKVRPAGPDKSGTHRDAQNEIRGYTSAGGAAPAQATRAPQATARPAQPVARPAAAPAPTSATATGKAAPPWRR